MRDLILISPRDDEEKSIIEQWKHRSLFCGVVSDGRITLQTEKGHIFIDYGDSESMYPYYEKEEIDFDIRKFYLYCISFSDLEFVKEFLMTTQFSSGCKLDNDRGMIIECKDIASAKGFFDRYSEGLE